MKLIYITNTRLPSEKANSYQSMQMCSSLAKYFDEVELWTGLSKNHKKFRAIKDIFGYYNLKNNFTIKIKCIYFEYIYFSIIKIIINFM